MHRRAWTWLAIAMLACGDSDDPRGATDASSADGGQPSLRIDAGAECQIFVADDLINHSCFHATMGPYRERDFTASSEVLEVNRAHTAFMLTLPTSGDGYGATMLYQVRNAGGYAFFSTPKVDLSIVRDGTTQELASFSAHDTELCPQLPWVQAFSLGAGLHELRLTSPTPKATLVIEWMDEGKPEYGYRSACPLPPRPDAGEMPQHDSGMPADGGDGSLGDCKVDPVLEHTCIHVDHGPYAMVTATETAAGAPNVDPTHTSYTVNLPGPQSVVTYLPEYSDEYVFYVGPGVTLSVGASDTTLEPTFMEPGGGCGLEQAYVYQVTGGTRYEIGLQAEPGLSSVTLLIEHVQALVDSWNSRWEACE